MRFCGPLSRRKDLSEYLLNYKLDKNLACILLWVHIKFHNVVKPQNNFILEIKYIGKIKRNAQLGQYLSENFVLKMLLKQLLKYFKYTQ